MFVHESNPSLFGTASDQEHDDMDGRERRTNSRCSVSFEEVDEHKVAGTERDTVTDPVSIFETETSSDEAGIALTAGTRSPSDDTMIMMGSDSELQSPKSDVDDSMIMFSELRSPSKTDMDSRSPSRSGSPEPPSPPINPPSVNVMGE